MSELLYTQNLAQVQEKPVPHPDQLVKTPYNADYFPKYREVYFSPSKTVPDQTMSLRTLIDRHTRGLPITGNAKEPLYHGDEEELPDLKKMDLSEIAELREANRQEIEDLQNELNKKHEQHLHYLKMEEFKKWKQDEQKTTEDATTRAGD
jgi:hypothetical protein